MSSNTFVVSEDNKEKDKEKGNNKPLNAYARSYETRASKPHLRADATAYVPSPEVKAAAEALVLLRNSMYKTKYLYGLDLP
jgi:hypothetical protein